MPRRKYTEEQANTAAELREQGLTFVEIGEKLGMNERSVQYHCMRLGADLPPNAPRRNNRLPEVYQRNGRIVRLFTPEEDAELLRLEATGMPTNQIARLMGRPANSTRGRLMLLAMKEARDEN